MESNIIIPGCRYLLQPNSIYAGRMEKVLQHFPPCVFDSITTDAPYGLGKPPKAIEVMKAWVNGKDYHVKGGGFMNKEWDAFVPQPSQWRQAYRVLKPGGHMLVGCGTRTQHWMGMSLEFAGFEIRDTITWHYGSGFPKNTNISLAIDKAAGAEREVVNSTSGATGGTAAFSKRNHAKGYKPENYGAAGNTINHTAPATDQAKKWDDWGTALKPATEIFILCRKPLQQNTIVANVLAHGTGGINIGACRIPFASDADKDSATFGRGTDILGGNFVAGSHSKTSGRENIEANPKGRWPANLILDPYTSGILDQQSGECPGFVSNGNAGVGEYSKGVVNTMRRGTSTTYGDTGGASRFFYCAKPTDFERHKGFEKKTVEFPNGNDHVTVKPISLMRWLVKLITPKGGLTLDCFCGSGSTLCAAKLELINYVGIDMDERNCRMSEIRVAAWNPEKYIEQTLF